MKSIILTVTTFLGYLSILVFSLWSIISFILYLVKDTPFDWTVFWLSIWMIPVTIILAIITITQKTEPTFKKKPKRQSRFQDRMDEMKADKLG